MYFECRCIAFWIELNCFSLILNSKWNPSSSSEIVEFARLRSPEWLHDRVETFRKHYNCDWERELTIILMIMRVKIEKADCCTRRQQHNIMITIIIDRVAFYIPFRFSALALYNHKYTRAYNIHTYTHVHNVHITSAHRVFDLSSFPSHTISHVLATQIVKRFFFLFVFSLRTLFFFRSLRRGTHA